MKLPSRISKSLVIVGRDFGIRWRVWHHLKNNNYLKSRRKIRIAQRVPRNHLLLWTHIFFFSFFFLHSYLHLSNVITIKSIAFLSYSQSLLRVKSLSDPYARGNPRTNLTRSSFKPLSMTTKPSETNPAPRKPWGRKPHHRWTRSRLEERTHDGPNSPPSRPRIEIVRPNSWYSHWNGWQPVFLKKKKTTGLPPSRFASYREEDFDS